MKAVGYAYIALCYGGPSRAGAQQYHGRRPPQKDAAPQAAASASQRDASRSQGSPVHRQLAQWCSQQPEVQPRLPEVVPMDCCPAPPSPTAQQAAAAFRLSPDAAQIDHALGKTSQHSGVVDVSQLLISEPTAAAASSTPALPESTSAELQQSVSGRGKAADSAGTDKCPETSVAVEATPLETSQISSERRAMLMSPTKRKAQASPSVELEMEAMQNDKPGTRFNSCRRLSFF